MAKQLRLQAYCRSLSTPQISNPESWILRRDSGIHDYAAPFSLWYFMAYDWCSGTAEICNLVQDEVLWFVWSQLWQGVTLYGCTIPAYTHLKSNTFATGEHVPQSVVRLIFLFPSVLSYVLQIEISGRCPARMSSIKTLHMYMQVAHPAQLVLIHEFMFDQDVMATATMAWSVRAVSTVHWRKAALPN